MHHPTLWALGLVLALVVPRSAHALSITSSSCSIQLDNALRFDCDEDSDTGDYVDYVVDGVCHWDTGGSEDQDWDIVSDVTTDLELSHTHHAWWTATDPPWLMVYDNHTGVSNDTRDVTLDLDVGAGEMDLTRVFDLEEQCDRQGCAFDTSPGSDHVVATCSDVSTTNPALDPFFAEIEWDGGSSSSSINWQMDMSCGSSYRNQNRVFRGQHFQFNDCAE